MFLENKCNAINTDKREVEIRMTGESDDSSTVFFCPNFSKAVIGKISSDLFVWMGLLVTLESHKTKDHFWHNIANTGSSVMRVNCKAVIVNNCKEFRMCQIILPFNLGGNKWNETKNSDVLN